jgi:GNAT superfamily N-acetyltransferase
LTPEEVVRAASTNLIRTYFRLGRATPGARVLEEEGFRACVGEFEHPICNFAADLDLSPWSARRLRTLASARGAFNVYALPGDQPGHLEEILVRAGFRKTYRLVQMVAEPLPAAYGIQVEEAKVQRERAEVARFMADQFFSRQPERFRRKVADATATATDLDLYGLFEREARLGAVMLCRSEGALGIYNLCVASPNRGRGRGGDLVRWCLAQAQDELVTLQCEPRLEGWYESLGFRSIGNVEVFGLSPEQVPDIMEQS